MEKLIKRLSIFFIFIFFISILAITFHHHEDGMFHDDCFICSLIVNNRNYLTTDTFEVFSNDYVIYTVSIYKDSITPCTLTQI